MIPIKPTYNMFDDRRTRPSATSQQPRHSIQKLNMFARTHQPTVSNLYLHKQPQQNSSLSDWLAQQSLRSFLSTRVPRSSQERQLHKSNFTFSYQSPPSLRKNNSSEGRFSTKKFKYDHFPHIGVNQAPLRTEVIEFGSVSPRNPVRVMNDQQTPVQPKILRMNKVKSSRCIIDKKQSQKESPELQSTPVTILLDKGLRESGIFRKQIDQGQGTSRELTKSDNESQVHMPFTDQKATYLQQKYVQNQKKQYPTVKSIRYFHSKNNSGDYLLEDSASSTSFNIVKDEKINKNIINQNKNSYIEVKNKQKEEKIIDRKDLDIAQSLIKELSLHYDYYVPAQSSDRSLSIGVQF